MIFKRLINKRIKLNEVFNRGKKHAINNTFITIMYKGKCIAFNANVENFNHIKTFDGINVLIELPPYQIDSKLRTQEEQEQLFKNYAKAE